MLIFLCVCMSAHVCVCVCVSRLPILFSFSPTHQAPRVWWAVISGCLCADGGGLEEGVKSADGRSESFKRCFKTHHGAFDGGGIWAAEVSAEWHLWNGRLGKHGVMPHVRLAGQQLQKKALRQQDTRLCSPSWNFKQASMFKIWVLQRAITPK